MRSLAILLLIVLLGSSLLASPVLAEAVDDQAPPPTPVVTAEVVREEVRSSVTLTGTATPLRQSAVAAEVSGQVAEMPAREGERVESNDILVRLRALPLELELQESQAALAEIEARLRKAEDDRRRAEELFEKGYISEEELQGRRTDFRALQRQLERQRAQVRRLRDRLERAVVRAPFSGQVVEERTEVGQWVAAGDPVATLADLSAVTIRVPVPERRIGEISPGDTATVRFEALPERSWKGKITAIVPQADLAARTFPVEVTVNNPEGRILAGMLAGVTFSVGEKRSALLVPKDAFVPQPAGGGYLVKVQEETAAIVPVEVLGSHGERFAVESQGPPLKAGDRVVVRGNERLRPSQRVAPAAQNGKGAP